MSESDAKSSSNPNSSLVIPEWINEELVKEVLKTDFPNFSKMTKFSPIAAIAPGENYSSTMIRVSIEIELKDSNTVSASYIIKTTIESSVTHDIIEMLNVFPKEIEFYSEVLPKLEKLYAEADVELKFGPRCKFIKKTTQHTTIIMEDLKQLNFSNMNRLEGLDLPHACSVLKKMAEFHAASAVCYERFGPFPSLVSKGYFTEEFRSFFKNFGSAKAEMFIEALTKWGDCERYIQLWPNPDTLFDKFIDIASPKPNEFNVLNHGDCWTNNIMFQHSENGEITDTYLIDYQNTQYSSPALDLTYFIITSTQYELRIKEFDYFLRIYQENLEKNLKLLKYPKSIPSLRDIHIMMLKYSLWVFYTATSALTAIIAEPSTEASVENIINDTAEGEQFRNQIIMNPRYVKAMKQILRWLDNRGGFDI